MTTHKLLFDALEATQKSQISEYQTTDFWRHASKFELTTALAEDRIHQFRKDPACLSYFVPTYGVHAMGLSSSQFAQIDRIAKSGTLKQKNTITNFLSGQSQANADYRTINGCITALGFNPFSEFDESEIGEPKEQFIFDGKKLSRPTNNYILGLVYLLCADPNAQINTVVELGGGHGALGEVLFKSLLGTKTYINFDIPPTCIYAQYYLSRALPSHFSSNLSEAWDSSVKIESLSGTHVRPNWDISNLSGPIDLFVNYHSFQEMEPPVVQNYISEIKRLEPTFLLLRNIKEGKQIKTERSAGVEIPTTSDDYIKWLEDQFDLISQDSRTFGYVTADNFHSELSLWKRKIASKI